MLFKKSKTSDKVYSLQLRDEASVKHQLIITRAAEMGIDNPELNTPEFFAIPSECIPTASVESAILAATWKRKAPVKELSKISAQQAKPLQMLRDRGFISLKNDSSTRYYTNPNFRMFVGWRRPGIEPHQSIQISAKSRSFLKKYRRDPVTGTRVALEIDHRTPIIACKKLNKAPATLNDNDVINRPEYFDKHFQMIERSRNANKREICKWCVQGEEIFLPEVDRGRGFKERWDNLNETTNSCIGCYYYSPFITQTEVTETEQAREFNKKLIELKCLYDDRQL